ncbi:hypothetical protein IGS68_17710 [Skermanella sp. TT6]|uniref:Type ISP restriction-modification enzyme LLaBIII C-terminal specificity domain-containing protein n=1 Tax=Skermanella cutis TaxID=2775420 RepID=A0ABX7B0Q0_9PROT|nr:type ISP restriction/modification enzyme [Skermanella sp. TT6]QQP87905.1 hypothetical protein IGS68_17710 [Skermanella sp. TT6]
MSNGTVREHYPEIMTSGNRFDAEATRSYLVARGMLTENIMRYCYRPFDIRWIYWEPETKLLDEKRAEYMKDISDKNHWLELREKQTKSNFDRGYVVQALADNMGNGLSSYFPLYIQDGSLYANQEIGSSQTYRKDPVASVLGSSSQGQSTLRCNVTGRAEKYLHAVGCPANDMFFHVVGILNCNLYRTQNADPLRLDWPRIPLPQSADLISASAQLGRKVADLHNPAVHIDGVSSGKVALELRSIGTLRRLGDGPLDLGLTARWGYAGQKGVTMPGRGDAREREFSDDEMAALTEAAAVRGLLPGDLTALLGGSTYDIFLNGTAYWSNVPARVWNYTIGGYQVIKKWLSYREQALLGRPLKPEEARYVTEVIRRIAALLLLEPALDDNYRAVAAAARRWTE